LGIFAWFGFTLPLKKRLQMIKQVGFTTTCLWFGPEEQMFRDNRADEMPGLVRDMGLELDNIHVPFENSNLIWSESETSRSIIHKELTTALLFCGKHRIPQMVMHLTSGENPPPYTQNGQKLISSIVSQAEDTGVTIALENVQRNDYLDFVFSNPQSPNLGFCYDSGHDFLSGQSRGSLLKKWGDRLTLTHFSDNLGITDDHLLPGKGSIDWEAIIAYFPKSTYKGTLMLEVDGTDAVKGFKPEEFLQIGYQWLDQFKNNLKPQLPL
jgi:sugar phosphate isomerase/epimerase